ncbi:MAG: hypothetical protein HYT76_09000 [Deltaproteobacteria bacterium]|nr:hypothetical protein [Deltaproteobacteria bacterium]
MEGVELGGWRPATPEELARFEELTILPPHPTFDFLETQDSPPATTSAQYTFEETRGTDRTEKKYECSAFFGNFSCRVWRDRLVLAETEWRTTPTLNESIHQGNPDLEVRAGDIDNDGDIDFAILSRRLGLVLVSHQEFNEAELSSERVDRYLFDRFGIDARGLVRLARDPIRITGTGF